MMTPPPPWRLLRQTLGLSLNEVARRTGIGAGRLSIVERGVPATEEEAKKLRDVLSREVLAGEGPK